MNNTANITILDHLMALNLDVSIWSARKKLTPADFGGTELPPEDLASLGSKKICNPQDLCIFGTLKARAVNLLDRSGVRFLGGWGIPEDLADDIVQELSIIRDEFLSAKVQFLNRYDEAIRDWIGQHPGWEQLIGTSTVSADYVRSRIDFQWQMFKLLPPADGTAHAGLEKELSGLGETLYGEVAKAATDAWHRCYAGKDKVSHKALSPLRTIHQKLLGLSFVEPRVLPVADLLQTAFDQVPTKGFIQSGDLLMLQGLVSLLRDPDALVEHGQKVLEGQDASDILAGLLNNAPLGFETTANTSPIPPYSLPPVHQGPIDSQGLW